MNLKNITMLLLALSCNVPVFSMQMETPSSGSDERTSLDVPTTVVEEEEQEETTAIDTVDSDDDKASSETPAALASLVRSIPITSSEHPPQTGIIPEGSYSEIPTAVETDDTENITMVDSQEQEQTEKKPRPTRQQKRVAVIEKKVAQRKKRVAKKEAEEREKYLALAHTVLADMNYKKLNPNEEITTEEKPKGNFLVQTVMHPLDNRRKALALFGTPAVMAIIYDAYATYCSALAAHHKKLTVGEFVMDLLKNPTKNMLFTGTVYGLLAGQLIFGIKDLVAPTQG